MRGNSKTDIMTYDEYIAQQHQAMDEERQDDSCFLDKSCKPIPIDEFDAIAQPLI